MIISIALTLLAAAQINYVTQAYICSEYSKSAAIN